MTQQEFDQQCREHKSRLKTINAGLLAQMQENKAAYKNTVARLLANLEKGDGGGKKKHECYAIHSHLRKALDGCDRINNWDVAHAEIKFNNQGDLLLFEIAILPTNNN